MRRAFVLLLTASLCSDLLPAAGAETVEPSLERGRRLYMTVGCVHCHGSEGQGSNAGPRLVSRSLTSESVAAFIRTRGTQMPAYSATVLDDSAVAAITAFLQSVPPARAADEIPELRSLK